MVRAARLSVWGYACVFSRWQPVYYFERRPGSGGDQNNESNLDIWVAEMQGDGWGEPKCLNLVVRYPALREAVMPRVTSNGTLYFLAKAPGGTRNDYGIYRAELINGEYAKPELLPRSINLPPFLNWAPYIVSFRQACVACLCRREPAATIS